MSFGPISIEPNNSDQSVPGRKRPGARAGKVQAFARTLEQELTALLRGVSLECLVCGEFVMHAREGVVFCPECGSTLGTEAALQIEGLEGVAALGYDAQAG